MSPHSNRDTNESEVDHKFEFSRGDYLALSQSRGPELDGSSRAPQNLTNNSLKHVPIHVVEDETISFKIDHWNVNRSGASRSLGGTFRKSKSNESMLQLLHHIKQQ